MTRILALILILLWTIAPVSADMSLLGVSGNAGGYTGPGDIRHNNAMAFYGLRCFRASQASLSKTINIRRASDNTTTDIGLTATCNLDVATAGTFCTATTCWIHTWYDTNTDNTSCDTSATCDLVQATTAQQPQLIFSCLGSLPCVRFTAGNNTNIQMTATCPGAGCASQSVNFVATWKDSGVSGYIFSCGAGGSASCGIYGTGANQLGAYFGGTGANVSATDNAFHFESAYMGTSGQVCVDNVTCTGPTNVGARAIVSPFVMGNFNPPGANNVSGDIVEFTIYANYTLTSAEQGALCHNSYSYWGTSVVC